jgi:hypothetical protein
MSIRLRAGLRTGLVAASATFGALIGFGVREGSAYGMFADAGQQLLARVGVGPASIGIAVALGVLLHGAWSIVWGVCFSVVAAPLRGVRLLGAALAFGALAWAVSQYVLPKFLSLGTSNTLGAPRLAMLYLLFASALAVGMRLAPVTR